VKSLSAFPSIYIFTGSLDMRLGLDRLSEKIRNEVSRSVFNGELFVFVSRCRRKVKTLYWDRDGYAMWMKRLEAGTFKIERRDGYEKITAVDLELLLAGTEYSRIKFRAQASRGLYG
jgi:transposase